MRHYTGSTGSCSSGAVNTTANHLTAAIICATIIIMGALRIFCAAYISSYAYEKKRVPDEGAAAKCLEFYNNDQHELWADCMGVGYVARTPTNRKDI